MTSWSRLIEKIQGLLSAFEEDLANSCCLSSSQPTELVSGQTTAGPTLPSEQVASHGPPLASTGVTVAGPSVQQVIRQQSCHDANMRETVKSRSSYRKSSSRSTMPSGECMPTLVQKMPLQLQPLKSKTSRRLQKKYKYVNKKFIVCKEARKGESNTELVDKERSDVNDPFEYVGTQNTSASETHDKWRCAGKLTLFEETSVDELSKVQLPVIARHRGRRQQQSWNEKALKQLAEDIASAESYSLVISQKCLTQSQDDNQNTETIPSANVTEFATTSHDFTTSEIVPAAGTGARDIRHCEATAGIETDVDIVCMPDRQSADCVSVNDEVMAENKGKEAECEIISGPASDVDMNVETEQQLHSAQVSDACSANVSTGIHETCLRSSGDRCDSDWQEIRMPYAADTVSVSSGGLSHTVISSTSDVSVSQSVVSTNTGTQHNVSQSKTMEIMSSSPQKTCQRDVRDINVPAVTVNGEHGLPSMYVGSCDRIIVKRSRKRRRKAQQKKCKSERMSTLQKLRSKAASLIDSDVEDNSSG